MGVLLDRKGAIQWVMVGDATRLYLPDIGRIRGGINRLRGLRLVVARPTPLSVHEKNYALSNDLKTDLEKLRLDAVIEIDASRDHVDGPLVLSYLARDGRDSDNAVISKANVYRSIHELKQSFANFIEDVLDDLNQKRWSKDSRSSETDSFERALLIGVYPRGKKQGLASMDELFELARSAKIQVVEKIFQWHSSPYPKTVVGLGKLEEICLRALSLGVEMLIFDCDLSPSQLMNITDMTDLKVLDRTMLILDIFAQRAVTREGKLQVEMAQLTYSLPRLAKKQSGLSRLTGGIGGRGPGETKLEVNRRRVKERLARLTQELARIKSQRELRRKNRRVKEIPTLAIVGYTNAGKSTLLNSLCGSEIYAKDELFATLDPHSRRLRFPHEQEVLLTDTVGFINHLPDSLMRAFMATLEELKDADLLLHVVDISNDNYRQQMKVVDEVLKELDLSSRPRLTIYNKIDLLSHEDLAARTNDSKAIAISAEKKLGLEEMIRTASRALAGSYAASDEKVSKITAGEEDELVFDERNQGKSRFTK